MRLFSDLARRLDRAMRHGPCPRPATGGGYRSRAACSSPHLAGLDVRPGTLSWLIARAVTLQFR